MSGAQKQNGRRKWQSFIKRCKSFECGRGIRRFDKICIYRINFVSIYNDILRICLFLIHTLFCDCFLTEFQELDSELDRLDSCLSVLEGWNENLHSECVKVLERMKEMRQQNTNEGEK